MYRYESWTIKQAEHKRTDVFQTVVLEKTLASPWDSKEIKPVNPKGNKPWIFIRRTDAEAETPILWPPDAKSRLTGKDPDAGKDWGEGDGRELDGWMASLTQWTWIWANSWRQWRAGKPGVLQYKESHVTEQRNNNMWMYINTMPIYSNMHLAIDFFPTTIEQWKSDKWYLSINFEKTNGQQRKQRN